jgi:hypothetical protein
MTFEGQIGEYRFACGYSRVWKIESGLAKQRFIFEVAYDV